MMNIDMTFFFNLIFIISQWAQIYKGTVINLPIPNFRLNFILSCSCMQQNKMYN